MMLDYDWSNNPVAAAAAMMLFGEGTNASHVDIENSHHHNNQMLMNHYGNMDYFQQAHDHHQGIPTTALFTNAEYVGYHHPLVPIASRIGLDLGVRTYFATGSEENERGIRRNSNMNMMIGRRRRRRIARCQAEGCGKDLTLAKHYHRRHKVCEYHSKASMVVAAGLSQRFCQQCSRFHILSEFDQGKRSCRKRLADHNRRRRKSQDLTTTSTSKSININPNNNNNNDTTSKSVAALINKNVNDNMISNKSQFNSENLQIEMGTKLSEACSSVTIHHDPQAHLDIFPAPQMELRLNTSSSAISITSTTMQQNKSCHLSQLGEYRELGNRFPASWVDDEAEELGMYHHK